MRMVTEKKKRSCSDQETASSGVSGESWQQRNEWEPTKEQLGMRSQQGSSDDEPSKIEEPTRIERREEGDEDEKTGNGPGQVAEGR